MLIKFVVNMHSVVLFALVGERARQRGASYQGNVSSSKWDLCVNETVFIYMYASNKIVKRR